MTQEIQNKLDALIDNKYTYRGLVFTINKYKSVSGNVVVFTTVRTFNLLVNEVDEFIDSLVPFTEKRAVVVPQSKTVDEVTVPDMVTYQKSATHIKLEDSLKTMIDKVMVDKDAIPQATALCNIANTMVNLEKQQLNFLKTTNQL